MSCPNCCPKCNAGCGFANCCCGCCSLRAGTMCLASLMLSAGVIGLFQGGWGLISAAINIVAGAVGCYATYKSDPWWIRIFYYCLVGILIVEVILLCVFIFYYQHVFAKEVENSHACDNASDKEECKRMVAEFSATTFVVAWATNMIFIIVINLWAILIVRSFMEILELGGTGDEKLSPEQYKAIHMIQERETTPLRQRASDA
eukprot:gnl/MRDRNA2_/MRDRNA2_28593_c0_seq1.p1 gnl/MRDRNA2_/MRDRNA2_28593_c0~~gnl/MRDRNA2_/MRDRNA2_28593_c0_seq1.p1  ORF type:complete len:203 (-),score=18.53 gnl/MRDRNA2_/MRDRNA2_28593_c0_seq1:40-648(-)